jgi:hypothetical protein
MTISQLSLVLALALAGCSSFPGTNSQEAVIDGVDVWKGANPSRPYRVLATVSRVGPDDSASYRDEEAFLASEARHRGADGVVVLNEVMVVSRLSLQDSRPVMAPKVEGQLIQYE